MSSNFGNIIQIGDILVSTDVVTEYFACDYARCKGCCCIIGDSGAPLAEDELQPLEDGYPAYSPLMSEEGKAAIARTGFFDIDRDGDLVTPCVEGSGACAYARIEKEPLNFTPTDEASILEFFGETVYIVKGEAANDKLTTPEDFEIFAKRTK